MKGYCIIGTFMVPFIAMRIAERMVDS
jgi:hypothetical protein